MIFTVQILMQSQIIDDIKIIIVLFQILIAYLPNVEIRFLVESLWCLGQFYGVLHGNPWFHILQYFHKNFDSMFQEMLSIEYDFFYHTNLRYTNLRFVNNIRSYNVNAAMLSCASLAGNIYFQPFNFDHYKKSPRNFRYIFLSPFCVHRKTIGS